jgi:hypothetical protein
MNTTKDLVQAIRSGNSTDIQDRFDEIMNNKLHTAIEAYKEAVVSSVFEESAPEAAEEFDLVEFSLDEGTGNLAGMSKHLLKTLTNDGAGENSEVESTGRIKNASALKKHIHTAMVAGHTPVVHVDGKPVKAAVSTHSYGSRSEYRVHGSDKENSQTEYRHPKPYRAGGKMVYPASTRYENPSPRYGKGDAIEHLMHSATQGEADAFKNKNIEVKIVKADKKRAELHAARVKNKPDMQSNYVKKTDDEKKKTAGMYTSDIKQTSTTSAGDNLRGIKRAAAEHLAAKKLAGKSSANAEADKLHAEIGKHLAAGNVRGAKEAISNLANHIHQHGLTTNADKIKDYADNLQNLKTSYKKDYAKKNLERLRNESEDESADDINITEDLDSLIEQILNLEVE